MIPAVYAICKFGSWAYLRVTRGYRVVGAERIPATGPLIIACNHVSYFDPPALGAAVPRPVSYMAKSELFAIPVLGPLIRALGAFPVDRSRGDVAAMRAAVRLLQGGAVFGIFPEGGRNIDGSKKPWSFRPTCRERRKVSVPGRLSFVLENLFVSSRVRKRGAMIWRSGPMS